ncbi:MAG TPA: BMP family ABC transporter substrate-binding protein [Acidimicrobiales bacterium]|nr:BMP family ABC transporter substrate-binding protein [Acidimicrobiales bacterium]
MPKRRHLRLLSGFVALGLLAAACGDDDDGDGPTTTEADAGTTDEGAASQDEVTLDELCTEAKDAGVEAPEGFTVRLVTDIGKVDDRTFNQFAFEGMQAAADCFGFDTSYIETVSQADYAQNIATSLQGGPDVVITTGSLLATDTLSAANANPDTDFIGLDQFHPEYPGNYVGVLYREDEGGYLAGVMAASLSETGVVGVVGGRQDVPPVVKLVNGYEAGAKSVNPDVQVLSVYNESFDDTAKGESDARQFIGEGADVIFGAGGKTGSAAVQAAALDGVWGIGVDQDEYFTTFDGGTAPGADRIATSAVKRVDIGVFDQIVAALDGTFEGGSVTFAAADGGVTYAPFHDADIPEEAAAALEEARQGLADGSIETGIDPVTGEPQ